MSSIWTPDGERPVGKSPGANPTQIHDGEPTDEPELTEEELAAQMEMLRAQLADTPAGVVIANHCYGLFELGALHLSVQPAQLTEAQLAIDALGYVVEGLGDRLGEHRPHLVDGLAQLRLAFVQIKTAQDKTQN